ncbi:MAG: hypothetical protein JSS46_04005 [Proteobacteria bacterium]|jgi:hypothetical protein|nr:hypothetical protein [Pseudomonadota bacterium]
MPLDAERDPGLVPATSAGTLGPWDAADFELAPPATLDGLTPSERFYFDRECVAVPRRGMALAGFARGVRAAADVAQWSRSWQPGTEAAHPALVLLGAPLRADRAMLDASARTVTIGGRTHPFALAPRLPLNRSWFDASSAAWFASRSLRLRASIEDSTVVARTLWPEDFALGGTLPPAALAADRPLPLALRAWMREVPRGGADWPFAAHGIRERDGWTGDWKDKPVLALVVNGAQGDDDEAWAGHFAVATGRTSAGGSIADLVVDNFYTLDIVSEKGILAAPVPLDAYLGDVNSGQAWYRPSCVLVAALASDAALALVQGAFDRVYRQFWRHQLAYRHSTMNCAGVSVDVLRALGLPVPVRAPPRRWRAWFALPWVTLTQRSLAKGRLACEYLAEDVTRLLPAAAFEEAGAMLLSLAGNAGAPRAGTDASAGNAGPLARLLARDIEAIALLRIPQFPSSRRFGSWPVASADEYFAAIPSDPAKMEIVPVPPRPFPRELRDDDLLAPPREPSDLPLAAWTIALAAALALFAGWLVMLASA